jgi:2-iminobutanoate/2-iminopropanoate deaminase
MPTREVVFAQDALPPLPVYSQGIISQGKHVFLSGNLGLTKDMKIVEGGVQAQTVRGRIPRLVYKGSLLWYLIDLTYDLLYYYYYLQKALLENIQKILASVGAGFENVVKANIFLTDLGRDFVPMNEVYKQVRLSLIVHFIAIAI